MDIKFVKRQLSIWAWKKNAIFRAIMIMMEIYGHAKITFCILHIRINKMHKYTMFIEILHSHSLRWLILFFCAIRG